MMNTYQNFEVTARTEHGTMTLLRSGPLSNCDLKFLDMLYYLEQQQNDSYYSESNFQRGRLDAEVYMPTSPTLTIEEKTADESLNITTFASNSNSSDDQEPIDNKNKKKQSKPFTPAPTEEEIALELKTLTPVSLETESETGYQIILKTFFPKHIVDKIERLIDAEVAKKSGPRPKKEDKAQSKRREQQQRYNYHKNYPKTFGDQFCDFLLDDCKIKATKHELTEQLKDKMSILRLNRLLETGLEKEGISRKLLNKKLLAYIQRSEMQEVTTKANPISRLCYSMINEMIYQSGKKINEIIEREQVTDFSLSIERLWPEVSILINVPEWH